jgi:hypothetical protein
MTVKMVVPMFGKRESIRTGVSMMQAGLGKGHYATMRPMKIDGIPTRTLRAHPDQRAIDIIDQTRLPHALHWVRVATLDEAAHAIRAMQVRGAR